VVLRVPPGSAAAASGLEGVVTTQDGSIIPGDIITAIEGKPVSSVSELAARLDDFRVGDRVSLAVMREGKLRKVQVILQAGE
jgi:S1-C subfamily serine protease